MRPTALVSLLLLVGCDRRLEVAPPDPVRLGAISSRITDQVFAGVAPDTSVIRCGDSTITAAHVAMWLSFFPRLTVEQAVEDLADLCAVRSVPVTDLGEWEDVELNARLTARAMTWIRDHVHADASLEPTPDDVAAFLADPANGTALATPRLCTASHVLILVDAEATAEVRALAQQTGATIAAAASALPVPVDIYDVAALAEPHRASLEAAGLTLRIETNLVFPERDQGAPTWQGLQAVVEPFAAATFSTEPGRVFGPTQSEFGVHIGVVEAFTEAVERSPEARERIAHDTLLARARARAMGERSAAVMNTVEVRFDAEAAALLTGDAASRMTASSAPD